MRDPSSSKQSRPSNGCSSGMEGTSVPALVQLARLLGQQAARKQIAVGTLAPDRVEDHANRKSK
jgi:hypothetical protein